VIRYRFKEVRAALHKHWGFSLHYGGDLTDLGRDGRFDVTYSKTGFVVGGNFPGEGYGYRRFATLLDVVRTCDLADVVAKLRKRARA
jgi:hypothetical protein